MAPLLAVPPKAPVAPSSKGSTPAKLAALQQLNTQLKTAEVKPGKVAPPAKGSKTPTLPQLRPITQPVVLPLARSQQSPGRATVFAGDAKTPVPMKLTAPSMAPSPAVRAVPGQIAAKTTPRGPSVPSVADRFGTPATAGHIPGLMPAYTTAQKQQIAKSPSIFTEIGRGASSVATDIPKELQGNGVVATAIKSGIGQGANAVAGLANQALGNLASNTTPAAPASYRRAMGAAVQADVPKELKGTGVIERSLGAAGQVGGAVLNKLESKATAPGTLTGAQFGLPISNDVLRTTKNLGADLLNAPVSVIPSLWNVGSAAVQAAAGNPNALIGQGKQLAQSFTPQGFEAHPLNALLMASGGASLIGRAGQAVTDLTGLTNSAGRVRPADHLVANLYDPKTPYSRDPKTYALQKLAEARPVGQAVRLAKTRSINELGPMPNPLSERLPKGPWGAAHRVRRMAAENVDAGEHIRRTGRSQVLGVATDAIKAKRTAASQLRQFRTNVAHPQESLLTPKIHGQEQVSLIGQLGITKPQQVEPVFAKELARLEALAPETNVELQTARQHTIESIRSALNNRSWLDNPQPSIDAARRLAEFQHTQHTPALVAQSQLTPQAADAARLVPYAWSELNLERAVRPTAAMNSYLAHQEARRTVTKAQTDLIAALRSNDPQIVTEAQAKLAHAESAAEAARVPKPKPADRQEEVFQHRVTKQVVTAQQVRDHMAANDRAEPLFVSHRPSSTASAMYRKMSEHPLAAAKLRSGDAWNRGLHDTTYRAVANQLLSERAKIDAHNITQDHLRKVSIFNVHRGTGENTGYFNSADEARRAVSEPGVKAQNPHDLPLVPLRMAPQFARQGQLQGIKGDLTPLADLFDPVARDHPFTDMTASKQDTGSWVLAPKDYVETVKDFEKGAFPGEKLLRGWTTQFRRSALSTSPHRVVGLPSENLMRAIPAGAGPMSIRATRRVLGRAESPEFNAPERVTRMGRTGQAWASQVRARALTGQVAGQALRERTFGGSGVAQKVLNTPALGHVIKVWTHTADTIVHAERNAFEGTAQTAFLGRAFLTDMHRSGLRFGDVLKMQGKAFDDFVEGLVGSESEVRFARAVDRMGGRYGKLSPAGRKAMLLTPFGLWYVNSLKFVYGTLPADHPIITGLLAAADTATEPQRAQQGLLGPLATGINQLVAGQQGGIPFNSTQTEQAEYYSPFGAVNDPVQVPLSMFAPQAQTAFLASLGDNFYGGKATMPGLARGAEVPPMAKAQMVVSALLDSIMPLSKAQTVLAGGAAQYGTSVPWNLQPYSDSQRKSTLGVLEGLFNPLKISKNRLASGSTSGSLGGGSLGGGSLGGSSLGGAPLN